MAAIHVTDQAALEIAEIGEYSRMDLESRIPELEPTLSEEVAIMQARAFE